MRAMILVVLGLAVGATCAAIAVNALAQRDAYARGVMQVMQHHYATLRRELRAGRCNTATVAGASEVLGVLGAEIEPAVYGESTPDAPFREFTQRLRDAVTDLARGGGDCTALAPHVERLGNACDACHRQYR